MNESFYKLPSDLAQDINTYEEDVNRFINGSIPPGIFKAKRVPRGIYEQRKDGTYMLRVRIAGGTMTGEQTKKLASLATEYGNGLLHATTRQDVQLHNISIDDTPKIMRKLMDVGLTSKGGGGNTVRNVAACPYAGICSAEKFDVTPCAHAVTEYLIPLVGSYNMPRKYKIAFSGCEADCALAQVTDLGFIAKIQNNQLGFRVVVGGGMGAHSRIADQLIEWIPTTEIIRVSEAIRRLFDKFGDRTNKNKARLRYVLEKQGIDTFREHFIQQMKIVREENVPEWQGEVVANSAHDNEIKQEAPSLESIDGIRCFPQRQEGFVAIPLHLPMGFISADDFAQLGDASIQFSKEHGLRTSRQQNLLIRFVKKEDVHKLANKLKTLKVNVLAATPLERFVACAGASTCRLGLCLARGAAKACAEALDAANINQETLQSTDIFINGCPNACGHQPVGPIGFFGSVQRIEERLVPFYRITLGGQCNAEGVQLGSLIGQVPAKALPMFLTDMVKNFQANRSNEESFSSYFNRMGTPHFKEIIERHASVPAYDEHPEFYRDFGVKEDFSLAGRGAGECGSGVFEVIQGDLAIAKKATKPFDILLPTVRALLITRGIDTQDTGAILREFEKSFIDTKLVAEEFRALLSRAHGYTQGWKQAFDNDKETISKLLDRVKLLYSTLDANLEFHPAESVTPPTAIETEQLVQNNNPPETLSSDIDNNKPNVELDLSGVPCPMNFVKAKLKLEGMEIGETLTIVIDDGEPIKNVPASLKNEGQTIEETTDLNNGHWKVTIRKEK